MVVTSSIRLSLAVGLSLGAFARPAVAAGPAGPATRPASITIRGRDLPARQVIDELSKQAGAVLPLAAPDLLEQNAVPAVTLDLDRRPFWAAMEEVGRKTGLEPVASPDDPYPRMLLGLG